MLREQRARLYDADSDAVFAGNGSPQVLDLLAAHLLLRADSRDVYVEAPTYDRAVQIFQRHGARAVGLPMERDGLAVDALQRRLDVDALQRRLDTRLPAFVYTIPDFQNPSGVTLSEPKRRAFVALAAWYGFPVVEDVTYRELRYHGSALPSLAQLAPGGVRVVTLGSLSKVLSPGLRVGYAIREESQLAKVLQHRPFPEILLTSAFAGLAAPSS